MKFDGNIGHCCGRICDFSTHRTLLSFYTFMPRSSTTSIFYCQRPSSPLELLQFKAATCFKQTAADWRRMPSDWVWRVFMLWVNNNLTVTHFPWVDWSDFFSPHKHDWHDCHPPLHHKESSKLFQHISTLISFFHLNAMLFKLSCTPLIHYGWGLTVCLVKSSASNASSLLKGAVDEGRIHSTSARLSPQ